MPRAVDRDDLGVDPGVEPEASKELLGSLQCQVLFLFDQPPDEVGQTTVGERHVAGPLENRDGRVSVEPAKTRRRRHPSRDTTDDHHSHGWPGFRGFSNCLALEITRQAWKPAHRPTRDQCHMPGNVAFAELRRAAAGCYAGR